MEAATPVRCLLYGGVASATAEALTVPLDVLKVRMQLQGESGARQYISTTDAAIKIFSKEGPLAFTKGLKPAVLRQLSYGSMRFGLYMPCKNFYGVPAHSTDPAPLPRALAGATAGGSAALICTPTDLIKVRMQADGLRKQGPPSYRGVWHAVTSIIKQEGLLALYTGAAPTMARAAVVASFEIASYDEIKCFFLRRQWMKDGTPLHLSAGMLSGFLATVASSPFDVVKSRLMSQPVDSHGRGMWYSSAVDCWRQSIKTEGWGAAYRGFWVNYLSKGPSVVLLFLLYEQVRTIGDRLLDGDHQKK